jgi:hypothetical protein
VRKDRVRISALMASLLASMNGFFLQKNLMACGKGSYFFVVYAFPSVIVLLIKFNLIYPELFTITFAA